MTDTLQLFDVVALLKELSEHQLLRGAVGTLVESLAPDIWLVEFCDDSGEEYALVELRAEQLMRLHHEPATVDSALAPIAP
jgi:Domain of unknown function (DUF4926)